MPCRASHHDTTRSGYGGKRALQYLIVRMPHDGLVIRRVSRPFRDDQQDAALLIEAERVPPVAIRQRRDQGTEARRSCLSGDDGWVPPVPDASTRIAQCDAASLMVTKSLLATRRTSHASVEGLPAARP